MFKRRRKPIDEADRSVGDRERARERTMKRAVTLLAAKPRSIGELRMRLLEKPWTDDSIVDAVLERLQTYGYLDDAKYAEDLVAGKLRQKPQGKRRLKFDLSRRELDPEVVDAAIESAFENVDERELIDEAIRKRCRIRGLPATPDDKQKLFQHLLRLGFDMGAIREAIADLSRFSPDEQPEEN